MNYEEMPNIIILNDENGNDNRFEFLDLIPYGGKEYVILLPVEDEDGDEIVILEYEGTDDRVESYVTVENEDDLRAVFDLFKERWKDEFRFTDAEND